MNKALLAALAVLAVLLFAAAGSSEVTSLSINNCGVLRGEVHLTIDVEPVSINDIASNSCQTEPDGSAHLTFYVPTTR